MTFLDARSKTCGVLLLCGAGFMLAGGCGSDDGKKAVAEQAGAAGADEGGGPSSGGSQGQPAGASNQAGAGQAGADLGGADFGGAGGAASNAGSPATGDAGHFGEAGAGGAPVAEQCVTEGNVTGFSLLTEPIYQGCPGSVVDVIFKATASSPAFTCCGVSTSEPSFSVPISAQYNFDDGGYLHFQVPVDAPISTVTYAVQLTCPTTAGDYAFALEVHDSAPPVVTSAPTTISAGDVVTITGENLDQVTSPIWAYRASNGDSADCKIDLASQTATSLKCTFTTLPASANATDFYELRVRNPTCGSASNRPKFLATVP